MSIDVALSTCYDVRRNAYYNAYKKVSWLGTNSRAMSIDVALSACCDVRSNAY